DGEIVDASDPPELMANGKHDVEAVIDRIVIKPGLETRLRESIRLALKHGRGSCIVCQMTGSGTTDRMYSTRFACPVCELSFPDLEPRSFSFNSPHGACPDCDGLGRLLEGQTGNRDSRSEQAAATECPTCHGTRLAEFSRSVAVNGLTIQQFLARTATSALSFIREVEEVMQSDRMPNDIHRLVCGRVLPDIASRLEFLVQVGLDYVSLDRPTTTLSGGELQRARLASCLGSGLLGACYILDEPTVGLHPCDTQRLIEVMRSLCAQGNSVLVVEHDTDVMRAADWIVDLGPGSGPDGGCIVSSDTPHTVMRDADSLTGQCLSQKPDRETVRAGRCLTRSTGAWLSLSGIRLHNLRDLTLRFPLGSLTCVCGVSGSGKSTAVMHCLVPAVQAQVAGKESTDVGELQGCEELDRVVQVDQNPIGRSGRSNAATYSGMWDEVRKVFTQTREARIRGFKARRFSFNGRDGRCAECSGQGVQKIEMHFMPDEFVTCAVCRGQRFNPATLAVRYRQRTVADVLSMRCDEATEFFESFPKLQGMLQTFVDVGLGYLTLGQSSLTLSGGEAQRVKLATELGRRSHKRTLYVLDEATSGVHPADVGPAADRLVALILEIAGGTLMEGVVADGAPIP
ncbi:MAG: ABC-ATPase UvrA, partial [Planctomycetaceae bacterium]